MEKENCQWSLRDGAKTESTLTFPQYIDYLIFFFSFQYPAFTALSLLCGQLLTSALLITMFHNSPFSLQFLFWASPLDKLFQKCLYRSNHFTSPSLKVDI